MTITKPFSVALLLAGLCLSPATSAKDAVLRSPCPELRLAMEGNTLRVTGGTPGAPCGIMVGLQQIFYTLPGGAVLYVQPMAFLVLGEFDDDGGFNQIIGFDGKAIGDLTVLFQAISVEGVDGEVPRTLRTSNLGELSLQGWRSHG